MFRRYRKLAATAAIAMTCGGASACANPQDEALLWQALGLAADIAIYDALLDNCSFYTSDYGYTYTDCSGRDDRYHHGGHGGGGHHGGGHGGGRDDADH